MATSQVPKSVRLFDELFSDHPTQDPRIPLAKINGNGKTRGYVKTKASSSVKAKKSNKPAVQFQEEPSIQLFDPTLEREKVKKSRTKPSGEPTKRKNKNYPDCTKDALLKAFEAANLPDYDKICEHELHITKVQPWERPEPPKPPTPPMKDLIKVFDATEVQSEESPTKRRKKSSPPIQRQTEARRTPIIDDSPPIEPSVAVGDTVRFKRGLKPGMISTPLGTSRNTRSNPTPPIIDPESPIAHCSNRDRGFLQPSRRLVSSRPIELVHNPDTRNRRSSRMVVSKSILLEHNDGPSRNLSEEQDVTLKPASLSSRRSSRSSNKSTGSNEDQNETVVEAPAKKFSPKKSSSAVEVENENLDSEDEHSLRSARMVDTLAQSATSRLLLRHSDDDISSSEDESENVTARTSNSSFPTDLLQKPSNFNSFFGCSSYKKTPNAHSTYRPFSIATTNKLHRTFKDVTLTPGSNRSFNRTILSTISRRSNATRGRSIIPPKVETTRKVKKVSPAKVIEKVDNQEDFRNLIRKSFAAAFNETRVIFDDGEEQILEPKDKVLALCDPSEIVKFGEILSDKMLKTIKKVGEGSYGEIFMTENNGNEVILKIIPFGIDDDEERTFAKLLPELVICSTFNDLRENCVNRTPNFINMYKASCVQGRFPKKLTQEFENFKKRKPELSENPHPNEYKADNLNMVMFLSNGGTDLESYQFKSGQEALSVFLQVTLSLAAAELQYEFEHRDLHWGNILVMGASGSSHEYLVDGARYEIASNGVTASIIDFSLSRLSKDGYVIHDDLANDEHLFVGDAKEDYQFEVYRMMRKENNNDWEKFCPKTNIFWLHYLIDKLLSKKFTSRSKAHKDSINSLKAIQKEILKFDSCHLFILHPIIDDILQAK